MTGKVKARSFAMLVAGFLAMGSSLFAHHGDAAYSPTAIELKGAVVTEYRWMNPHSLIKVRHKNEKGEERVWTMEMGGTVAMIQLGFSKITLKPGDVITAWIYPTKNGTPAARMHRLIFTDGTELHDMDPTEPPPVAVDYYKK